MIATLRRWEYATRHVRQHAVSLVIALFLRPRPAGVYLGQSRVAIRTAHGHPMILDSGDASVTPSLVCLGLWEPWVTMTILLRLRPGMTVVEVGANAGYFSVLMARTIGPTGRLVAFEANPRMAAITRTNLAINFVTDWAECAAKAASDVSGTLKFNRLRRFTGSSSLGDLTEEAKRLGDEIDRIEVEATTLDAHLGPDCRVDFMRLDAEGAELSILKGAQDLLARCPDMILVLEFLGGAQGAALLQFLDELGFSYRLIGRFGRLHQLTSEELMRIGHQVDLLAEHRRH